MNNLARFLESLNDKLNKHGIVADLVLCGAYAIELHGFRRGDVTEDIDSITSISDQIRNLILEVSKDFSNDEKLWLNSQASDLSFPKGYESRLKEVHKYSNIKIRIFSVEDLILLKVNAWLSRGEYTNKDLNDLQILGATSNDIENGIEFIKGTKSFKDLPAPFQKKSLELLDDLKKFFRK